MYMPGLLKDHAERPVCDALALLELRAQAETRGGNPLWADVHDLRPGGACTCAPSPSTSIARWLVNLPEEVAAAHREAIRCVLDHRSFGVTLTHPTLPIALSLVNATVLF
jgi:hypothetical protein